MMNHGLYGLYGPVTKHEVLSSVKEDGNDIVIRFISWKSLYLWEIYSYSPITDTAQVVINDNGRITVQ